MNSLKGHLLVASPHLPDPNFYHTVVLLVQHQDEGALGLVLNRPSDDTLQEVWQQVSDVPCAVDQPILLGGPLEGPLMAVHTQAVNSESEILPGIFFATQRENLQAIVTQTEKRFRVFSGYAGWGDGQLENELKVGGWLTIPAKDDYVFASSETDLWQTVVHEIGKDILFDALNIHDVPDDPSMN